jgi:hypothetical protein
MTDFNKLFGYLGQQYTYFHRENFLKDEFKQLFPSPHASESILSDFVKNNFLKHLGNDIYQLTPEIIRLIPSIGEEAYKSGSIKGGEMKIDRNKRIYTILIEFDTSLKFERETSIVYLGSEILFSCELGYLYTAKINTPTERNLPLEEEKINRYLSHLSYHFRVPISIESKHASSSDITTKTKTTNLRGGIYVSLPQLPTLTLRQYQAISFYRQYKNFSGIDTRESYYYQLLSLIKILEGINPTRAPGEQKKVVIDAIKKYRTTLPKDQTDKLNLLDQKLQQKHEKNFEDTIWEHYRHGVSHWREKWFLDPDAPDDNLGSILNSLIPITYEILKHEYGL